MYTFETRLRVRYAETDQMGFVYHGQYAQYDEVARVEALRNLGVVYKDIEMQGIAMPVVKLIIKYIKPAFYDEELIIKTIIDELPGTRIKFNYEIYNENGVLINIASTEHAFVSVSNKKPCKPPEIILEKLASFFKK